MTFELKREHIKLLSKMKIGWDIDGFGVPGVDRTSPFGFNDSTPYQTIAEILGIEKQNGDNEFTVEQDKYMMSVYRETDQALQIILQSQSFQPGIYKRDDYYTWRIIEKR